MESVGVALGIAGLAGLFTTCLQLFDLISSTKSHGSACQTLLCKLEAEQVLLLKWGEAVGIFNPQNSGREERNETYDKRLDDALIRKAVFNTLSCLKTIFEDTNNLVAKYGLRAVQSEDEVFGSFLTQKSVFQITHEKLRWLPKLTQHQASSPRRTRWEIQDRAKFELLIAEIRGFNESLGRLLPEVVMAQKEDTRAEVGKSDSIAALKFLEEASKGTHDDLSDAASLGLCSLSDLGSVNGVGGSLQQTSPQRDEAGCAIGLTCAEPQATAAPQIEKPGLLDTIMEEKSEASEESDTSLTRRCRCGLKISSENSHHVCILETLQNSPQDYAGTILNRIRSCEDFTATANFIRSNPPSTPATSSSPTAVSFPENVSSLSPPPQTSPVPIQVLLPAFKKSRFHPYQNPNHRNPPTEPRRTISFDTGRMSPPASTSNPSSSTPIYQRRYQRPPSRLGSRSPPGYSSPTGGAADYNTGLAVAKSPMIALQDQSMGLAGVKSPMQALIDQERVLAGVKSPMQAMTNLGNLAGSVDGTQGGQAGYSIATGAGPADDGAGPAGH